MGSRPFIPQWTKPSTVKVVGESSAESQSPRFILWSGRIPSRARKHSILIRNVGLMLIPRFWTIDSELTPCDSHPLYRWIQEGRVRLSSQVPFRSHGIISRHPSPGEMAAWHAGSVGCEYLCRVFPIHETITDDLYFRTVSQRTVPSSIGMTGNGDILQESLRRPNDHMRPTSEKQ